MTPVRPVPPEDGWRTRVTEADIHAARTAWWDARQRGESPLHVAELWTDLVRLFRAEAEQIAREFWAHASALHDDVPQPRRGDSVPD